MKNRILAHPAGIADEEALGRWVHRGVSHARTTLDVAPVQPDLPRTFVLCTEGKKDEAEPPYLARVMCGTFDTPSGSSSLGATDYQCQTERRLSKSHPDRIPTHWRAELAQSPRTGPPSLTG